jgi:vancomycin resistance protein YoaR
MYILNNTYVYGLKIIFLSTIGCIFVICLSTPNKAWALQLTYQDTTIETPEFPKGTFTIPTTHPLQQNLLSLEALNGSSARPVKSTYIYNPKSVYLWLESKSKEINTPPTNAIFEEKNGEVVNFAYERDGVTIDTTASSISILKNLSTYKEKMELEFVGAKAKIHLADINKYGISQRLTRGESTFPGSSKNRRANIQAGADQVKGTLIAPGAIFSFNDALGDVTAEKGFKPELVIKSTGLAPELGGGICQVSSTVFRSAYLGGFPIVERKNHSFTVRHYGPYYGTDATVYSPILDLKFRNDTANYILVWAEFPNEDTLVFDIYGKDDGRNVQVFTPEYYDRKSDGSMKTTWRREVTLNGLTRKDVVKSVYLPPALFKKVEQFPLTGTHTEFRVGSSSPQIIQTQ